MRLGLYSKILRHGYQGEHLGLCWLSDGQMIHCEGLEGWFSWNIVTDFSKHSGYDVANLITRMVGIPPMWQVIAWSTENEVPQLHEGGVLLRFHPYLRHRALWNSPLCKWKPCSATGKTVSHAEDPFSWAVGSAVPVCLVLTHLVSPFSASSQVFLF